MCVCIVCYMLYITFIHIYIHTYIHTSIQDRYSKEYNQKLKILILRSVNVTPMCVRNCTYACFSRTIP